MLLVLTGTRPLPPWPLLLATEGFQGCHSPCCVSRSAAGGGFAGRLLFAVFAVLFVGPNGNPTLATLGLCYRNGACSTDTSLHTSSRSLRYEGCTSRHLLSVKAVQTTPAALLFCSHCHRHRPEPGCDDPHAASPHCSASAPAPASCLCTCEGLQPL
jgi:hypothetical protein